MGTGSKILVTVICVIVFFVFSAIMLEGGGSRFFVGMMGLGLFYGLRAMFRGSKESETAVVLDKSSAMDEGGPSMTQQ